MNSAAIVVIFLLGICLGISLGILLCALFDRWSKSAAGWIITKLKARFGSE